MTELTRFSVIVPVYNGAETLDECLTALVNQDYPPDQYEVLVVNDGSTDNSAQIASRYPVRLINLETNEGRIIARKVGAEEARFETLVFNDVRVISESQLLTKVSQRNYQPLIPNIDDYDGTWWGFARFFFLLRLKIYAPYYPLSQGENEFKITLDNFDKVPKGTTSFVCDRELWLGCQPEVTDKLTSDDTRILRQIVQHRPILRTRTMSARYQQRTELNKVIAHTFQRGPLFADYYLRPGGRYRIFYLGIWLALGLLILVTAVRPAVGALGGGLMLLMGLAAISLYLSQRFTDLIVVIVCLPIIAIAFGLGILRWQLVQSKIGLLCLLLWQCSS